MDNDEETIEANNNRDSQFNFYSKLCDEDSYQLTRSELYRTLVTFLRNKTAGNDG